MRNLGPKSEQWLEEAGITSVDQLTGMGAVAAFQLVKMKHPQATRNLLWALQGAIDDCDWREFSEETKRRLNAELESGF